LREARPLDVLPPGLRVPPTDNGILDDPEAPMVKRRSDAP
jgi:hypothetical protein